MSYRRQKLMAAALGAVCVAAAGCATPPGNALVAVGGRNLDKTGWDPVDNQIKRKRAEEKRAVSYRKCIDEGNRLYCPFAGFR